MSERGLWEGQEGAGTQGEDLEARSKLFRRACETGIFSKCKAHTIASELHPRQLFPTPEFAHPIESHASLRSPCQGPWWARGGHQPH